MFKITPEVQEWLKTRKLEISTPMFGGMCDGRHRALCLTLQPMLTKLGITHKFTARFNESLIPRGRNKAACKFLQSDYTDFLFLDADIWLDANDILHMLILSRDHKGIMCAPYAKKGINWDRIGKICSQPKEYPVENMPAYGGVLVANWLKAENSFGSPQKVLHSGTGIMLIPRYVFETMIQEKVVLWYKFVMEERLEMGTDRAWAFFEAKVNPRNRMFPSEDWYFCERYAAAGGTTWLCPWIVTKHVGPYEYEMNIPAIAQTGETL